MSIPETMVRSLLSEAPENDDIRHRRPAASRAAAFALLPPVGLGLAVASIAPVAFRMIAMVGVRRRRAVRRSAREQRAEQVLAAR